MASICRLLLLTFVIKCLSKRKSYLRISPYCTESRLVKDSSVFQIQNMLAHVLYARGNHVVCRRYDRLLRARVLFFLVCFVTKTLFWKTKTTNFLPRLLIAKEISLIKSISVCGMGTKESPLNLVVESSLDKYFFISYLNCSEWNKIRDMNLKICKRDLNQKKCSKLSLRTKGWEISFLQSFMPVL